MRAFALYVVVHLIDFLFGIIQWLGNIEVMLDPDE